MQSTEGNPPRVELRVEQVLRGEDRGPTVMVAWPPGLVARPTQAQKLAYLINDNSILVAGLIGLGLLTAYYIFV